MSRMLGTLIFIGQFLPGIVPTGGWGYNWGGGPAWDSASTHIPWYLYLYSGDRRILETHYDRMRRYMDFMASMATGHIVSFGLGDWCPPGAKPDGHQSPTALTSDRLLLRELPVAGADRQVAGQRRSCSAV